MAPNMRQEWPRVRARASRTRTTTPTAAAGIMIPRRSMIPRDESIADNGQEHEDDQRDGRIGEYDPRRPPVGKNM